MGGYQAIGPIILGLSHPVNDLSRGASCQDIIDLTYITAVQYLTKNKQFNIKLQTKYLLSIGKKLPIFLFYRQ